MALLTKGNKRWTCPPATTCAEAPGHDPAAQGRGQDHHAPVDEHDRQALGRDLAAHLALGHTEELGRVSDAEQLGFVGLHGHLARSCVVPLIIGGAADSVNAFVTVGERPCGPVRRPPAHGTRRCGR